MKVKNNKWFCGWTKEWTVSNHFKSCRHNILVKELNDVALSLRADFAHVGWLSSSHLQSEMFFQLKTVSAQAKRGGYSKRGLLEWREMPLPINLAFLNLPFMWPWLFRVHMSICTKELKVCIKWVEELCYFNYQNSYVVQNDSSSKPDKTY